MALFRGNNFIPATEWNLLNHEVQLIVMKQFPISNRVALERVDKNYGTLSQELFNVQEKVPMEDEFEDYEYPYHKLIIRCPMLKEFDFNRFKRFGYLANQSISINALIKFRWHSEDIVNGIDFKSFPRIRSFRNIADEDDVNLVTKFLKEFRSSPDRGDEIFEFIDFKFLSVKSIQRTFHYVDYKVKRILFPGITSTGMRYWEHFVDRISPEVLVSIDRNRFTSVSKKFNHILNKILMKPELKLKYFRGEINQENFDLLSNCSTLVTFKPMLANVKDITNLVNYVNVENLDLLNGDFLNFKNETTDGALINYFMRNGCKLRSLSISLCDRLFIIRALANHCTNLKFFELKIECKDKEKYFLVRSLAKLRSVEYMKVRSSFTKLEYEFIIDSLPKLIRFDYEMNDEEL